MKKNAIFSWSILLALNAYAQISPPDLLCIEGSGTEIELIWSPSGNPCGPVIGYEIYYSDSPDGPWDSITVNDPSRTDTIFPNNDAVVYCYMESIMDCPGQTRVPSDTLIWDLSPPEMKAVSVNENGQVTVTWHPSSSSDIGAYLVYVDGANIPDTVYGNTSITYTDPVSDPAASTHNYRLAWWRDCVDDGDRRGSIGLPYNSLHATNLQQDRCERTFRFSWTRYENYEVGIRGYAISVSVNGDAFQTVDTVGTNQQIYTYPDALTGAYYCFRVGAVINEDCTAWSNNICDTARVAEIPSGGHVRNATVVGNNSILLEYYPDTSGVIDRFNAERSADGTDFIQWPVADQGTTGNPPYSIYLDNSSNPSSRPYSYRFVREDECGGIHISDTIWTVWLNASMGSNYSGVLEWTDFIHPNGEVSFYYLYEIRNGDTSIVDKLGPGTLAYNDVNTLDPSSLETVCYFVVAEIAMDIPGIGGGTIFSSSNSDCLDPLPRAVFPRAFCPSGFNNEFKPLISFGSDNGYQFRIYDRYGSTLFETSDPGEGWDGNNERGEPAPLDNYVYYISFEGQDGVTYTDSGNVILLR